MLVASNAKVRRVFAIKVMSSLSKKIGGDAATVTAADISSRCVFPHQLSNNSIIKMGVMSTVVLTVTVADALPEPAPLVAETL